MKLKMIMFVAATFMVQPIHAATEAQSQIEQPWGTYSSLCVHEETGDILGIEISFVYFPDKDTSVILYQHAQGELPSPKLLIVKQQSDGSSKLQVDNADTATFVLEAKPRNKLVVKLKNNSTSETTSEEMLSKRAPVWGEGRKLPVCQTPDQ